MQVPVACMKNVGHTQAIFLAEAFDFAHHLRKRGTRNYAVLDDVVWRDVAHRGEGGLASLPDKRALGFGLRHANFPSSIRTADFFDMRQESFDFRERSIELDEQKSAAIRVIRMNGSFSCLDG